ncbi:hypothetical protein SDC9_134690 [bioreactor metagenome]|uniref:Uncharacterized protein n=1 Tax=bioreactor metagenome TaxID=1076179 RepID=A0A645DDM1_9ZZZZ
MIPVGVGVIVDHRVGSVKHCLLQGAICLPLRYLGIRQRDICGPDTHCGGRRFPVDMSVMPCTSEDPIRPYPLARQHTQQNQQQ